MSTAPAALLAHSLGTVTFGPYPPAGAMQVAADIQELIGEAEAGGGHASEQLFAALYGELHRLAERQLARGPGLSLGTTTLLHEAYLDIAGRGGAVRFPDRARFMGYAARAMRGLVTDYARRSRAQKRGGGAFEITLTSDVVLGGGGPLELEHVSEAVDELAAVEPPLAQLVDLHFFCGFSFVEIAAMRGVSERTVQRDWRKARLFLHGALRDAAPLSEG